MDVIQSTEINTAGRLARGNALPAYAVIPEWCRLSGVGRSSTYEALSRGDLRAVKLGSRTLIDVAHGLAWLDNLPVAVVRPHAAKRADQAA